MYGLPTGLNLSFLHERSLLQLWVGLHEFILNFDQGVSITVTSSIGFELSDGPYRRYEDFREAVGIAATLLNERVTLAQGKSDGTLCLEFGDHRRVDVFDDSTQYESYTIRNQDQLIVV
jgi:hypothetical protein